MTFIPQESIYWILATMAQCSATLIGASLVAYFFFAQKQEGYKNKSMEDARNEYYYSNNLEKSIRVYYDGMIYHLSEIQIVRLFIAYLNLRLSILLILSFIGLCYPTNDIVITFITMYGIAAFGYTGYQIFRIVFEYKYEIEKVRDKVMEDLMKDKFFKKQTVRLKKEFQKGKFKNDK